MIAQRSSACLLTGVAMALFGVVSSAKGDFVSGTYSPLAVGSTIDLTAQGTLDWAKYGTDNSNSNLNFFVATKIGNPVISPNITPIGPPGTTLIQFGNPNGPGSLNFTWTNGNFGMGFPGPPVSSVNSVITETILPAQNSYPLGLGAQITASVASNTRVLDVYVQGFNSVMTVSASLSGGASTSTNVTPDVQLPDGNFYAFGVYEIDYSGDPGETLTVSVQTSLDQPTNPPWATSPQAAFPNAGIFAATVTEASAVPEPASFCLMAIAGVLGLSGRACERLALRPSRK